MNPQKLKGFRDFSAEDLKLRYRVIDTLKEVFSLFGFSPLETPALEMGETLKGKYGPEADKLLYTFTDRGGREVGMRYDLTVPLSRFIAENSGSITLPFKRYQIQPVWRAENTQRGRYREFLQCDADIVGSRSPLADAEIIAVSYAVFQKLGLSYAAIQINRRQVLFKLLTNAKISSPEIQLSVLRSLDKINKIGKDGVEKELSAKGLSSSLIETVFANIQKAEPDENLAAVIALAKELGVPAEKLCFESTLSRGLDYYTGVIFEISTTEGSLGSLAGGGRYDNLIEKLGGPALPATGIALGFERIIEVLKESGLGKYKETGISVLVIPVTESETSVALKTLRQLRQNGLGAEIYPELGAKMEKQLKYADRKGRDFAVIIGPEETANKTVVLKNLRTQSQEVVSFDDLTKQLESCSRESLE